MEKDGVRVQIRRSKTDQEGKGAQSPSRPVEALTEWLEAAQIRGGAVFRPGEPVREVRGFARLTDCSTVEIVKRYAGTNRAQRGRLRS
jgi:hypothetical protein